LLRDFAQISRIARFVRQHGRAADYLRVRDLGQISQNLGSVRHRQKKGTVD